MLTKMLCMAALATGAAAQNNLDLSLGAGDACNFGPTHHSHIVLPTTSSVDECKKANATFVMSHGATFFCPHTFDVKLLATITEDSARELLCDIHFESIEKGVSPKMVLRPTLPAGGLPALARGELTTWQSPVMYHVHNFGRDNDAGPDKGWNVTTVRNDTTTIQVVRRLYGRQLDVQPKPASLTYLAHSGGSTGKAILSHYISTSGSSGFDHILKADITTETGSAPITLRTTWPTYLTVPDRGDSVYERLQSGEKVSAELHMYNSHGLPATLGVILTVTLDYYSGISDGFAGFGTMCPHDQPPRSPMTCL